MQHHFSGDAKILQQLLNHNTNPAGYKQVLDKVAKDIEQRTFWYFTSDDADYLGKIYDKQLNSEVLKNRIRQITNEQMDDVFGEIVTGKLKKQREEETGTLEVQLGLQDFYDSIPSEDERAKKGKQRVQLINQDFLRFKEIMEQKKKLIERKKQEKKAMEQQFRKSLEQQKREEKKAEIRKHLEELKKVQDERKEQGQKFKSFLKEYKQAKPLHVAMQEAYKQKVVLPQLEESRKRLQSMPHRTKPSLQQINEHERQYLQSKSTRQQKYVSLNQTIDISYKSHFYVQQQQKLREQKQFEELGPSWDFLEKKKRYSQFVKEKVKPKVSPKLRQSLEENIKQGHHHPKQCPDRSKVIEVGKSYLQYMRSLEKRRTSTPLEPVQKTKQSRYFNYLQEMKTRSEHHTSSMDWERDMRDKTASKLERREKVLMKSKQLEEKAKRDEKLVEHYNYARVQEIIEKKRLIDDTLLSSVKAKVAVLKDARER